MKALFVCYDGKKQPSAKLRCYLFSEYLNKLGIKSEVFSFKDHLGAMYDGGESYKTPNFHRLKLLIKAILRLLKEKKDTVFIVQKAGFHSFAPVVVSYIKGNPLIMDFDDFEYTDKFSISNMFFHILLRRSKRIVVASVFLKEFIEKKTSKDVTHISGGTDVKKLMLKNLRKLGDKFTFVLLGNINDKTTLKGVYYLLDCQKQAHQKNKKIHMHIRANGVLMSYVASKIKRERIKNAEIISWVDDLESYLANVECGVFAIAERNNYNASRCPGKIFEYMAMSMPTIATDFGESRYIVVDNETGFLADSKKIFAEKMVILSKNRTLYYRLGKNARKRAEKEYDVANLAKKYKKVIESIKRKE